MPLKWDLIHETFLDTGTGPYTLINAHGRRPFGDVVAQSDTGSVFVHISHRDTGEYMGALGSFKDTGGHQLTIDTVLYGSNGASPVSFAAGTKDVVNDIPAANQPAIYFDSGTPNFPSTNDLWVDSGSASFRQYGSAGAWITAAKNPAINDGAALGTSLLGWSDLFLADGGAIYASTDEAVRFNHVASAVNNLTIAPAAASGYPSLGCEGTDTNIQLQLYPKGDAGVLIKGTGAGMRLALLADSNMADNDAPGFVTFYQNDIGTNEWWGGLYHRATDVSNGTEDSEWEIWGMTGGTVGEIASFSNGGISFDAGTNVLDDYEEGTWTPAITGSTTNPTTAFSYQFGDYTKVGNVVHFTLGLTPSTYSGGSGVLEISLPFVSNEFWVCACLTSNVEWSSGTHVQGLTNNSSALLTLFSNFDNGARYELVVGDLAVSDLIEISGSFTTAS